MSKKETVKDVITRMADEEIPMQMNRIMTDKDLSTETKVHVVGLLETAQYHLRLAGAGIE